MSEDNNSNAEASEIEELADRLEQLEEENEQLHKRVESMRSDEPTLKRRSMLKGAGALGLGAVLGSAGASELADPATADTAAPDFGTHSTPIDTIQQATDYANLSSTPASNPPSGFITTYWKGGSLYGLDENGNEMQVGGGGGGGGALSDSGSDNADGGDIYQMPQVQDSIDGQGGLGLSGVESIETDQATVTDAQVTSLTATEADITRLIAALDANGYDISAAGGLFGTEQPNVDLTTAKSFVTSDAFVYETHFPSKDNLGETTSGSGSVNLSGSLTTKTGTTSGSSARSSKKYEIQSPVSAGITWDRDRHFRTLIQFNDTSGPLYFVTGAVTTSDKTFRHVGVAMKNGDLIGTVGDGSTETTTTLISSASTGPKRIRVEFITGTKAEFFVDGTSQGTISSGLPSGNNNAKSLWFMTAENSSATNRSHQVQHIRIVQEP